MKLLVCMVLVVIASLLTEDSDDVISGYLTTLSSILYEIKTKKYR